MNTENMNATLNKMETVNSEGQMKHYYEGRVNECMLNYSADDNSSNLDNANYFLGKLIAYDRKLKSQPKVSISSKPSDSNSNQGQPVTK